MDPIKHNADSRLGFTLHTITGFHRPSLTHYYGFICHLTLATFLDHSLNDTSNHLIGSNARLPQLLHWLPVRNSTLKHKTGLTEYRDSRYFARLPTCLAESGSLSLCTSNFLWLPSDPVVGQQRPCHSDYLPLSQGDSGFFQPDGFASFAGQTKKASDRITGPVHVSEEILFSYSHFHLFKGICVYFGLRLSAALFGAHVEVAIATY